MASKLVVFHDNAEKKKLLQDLSEAASAMEKSREINSHVGPDIIVLPQTLKDIVTLNEEMKKHLIAKRDLIKN
ncbi:hypothetical protein [Legionella tunisiensis]|uniref:hypothetical protein n=1 Tax=Legionella tunisiensis TaxID=1034944 RepID=UPI00031149CE|nr:hypothetical protein [Legionella tunisiensis]